MARVVYDFYMTQAARALEIACDKSQAKSYRLNRPYPGRLPGFDPCKNVKNVSFTANSRVSIPVPRAPTSFFSDQKIVGSGNDDDASASRAAVFSVVTQERCVTTLKTAAKEGQYFENEMNIPT